MWALARSSGGALTRVAMTLFLLASIAGFGALAASAGDAAPAGEDGNSVVAREGCPDDYPVDCGDKCCPEGTQCCAAGCCEPCPSDYPVDCGDGGCCPAGTGCCGGGGCCENGFPHYCRGRCYRTLDDAIKAGCSRGEVVVCGAPH
ncbi:MAG TPA: hypothetical protein GX405_12005 [Rhizobiales bacterium]|nr:hypothetical protein [Hyphomicrobiales bacterium]